MNTSMLPSPVVKALTEAILRNVDNTAMFGNYWPDDATHCVTYVYHTWPVGWESQVHIQFFTTEGELNEFVERMRYWAELEDNDFGMRAYAWDWGPVPMPLLTRNPVYIATAVDIVFDTCVLTDSASVIPNAGAQSQAEWDAQHGSQYDTEQDYKQ